MWVNFTLPCTIGSENGDSGLARRDRQHRFRRPGLDSIDVALEIPHKLATLVVVTLVGVGVVVMLVVVLVVVVVAAIVVVDHQRQAFQGIDYVA